MPYSSRLLLAVSCVCTLVAFAPAQVERTVTLLDLGSGPFCVWDANGGQRAFTTTDELGDGVYYKKHISGVKYEDITVQCVMGGDDPMQQYLAALLSGKITPISGVCYTFATKDIGGGDGIFAARLNFSKAWPVRWEGPELDASSNAKTSGLFKVTPEKVEAGSEQIKRSGLSQDVIKGIRQSKTQLQNAFSVEFDGAPVRGVLHVDSIKFNFVDADGDGAPDHISIDPFTMTLNPDSMPPFTAWFASSRFRTERKDVVVNYYNSAGQTTRLTLSCVCSFADVPQGSEQKVKLGTVKACPEGATISYSG